MMPPDPNPYANIPSAGRLPCPLAENPQPECYCFEMSSVDIPDLQRFCGRNHRQCRIYRKTRRIEAPGYRFQNFAGVSDSPKP